MSDKLRTVRKGYPAHVFDSGGPAARWRALTAKLYGKEWDTYDALKQLQLIEQYMNSTGGLFGLSKLNNMFSNGNIGTTAKTLAPMAIGTADKLLNKGASNAVGNTLNTIGAGLMAIPGGQLYGAIAMGAGLVANGLTNKTNHAAMNAKFNEFNNYASLDILANNTTDAANAFRARRALDIGKASDYTTKGFLAGSGKSKRNFAAINNAALAAQNTFTGNLINTANNVNITNTMGLLKRLGANGGMLENVDPASAIGYALFSNALANNKFETGGDKGKTVKAVLDFLYNAIGAPIHAIFGNPGNTGGYSGGRFNGSGAGRKWGDPEYYYNDIYAPDTLLVPTLVTFNDAFKAARRRGDDTFEFNGKIYTTEMSNNPNWKAAGDARTSEELVPLIIPADTVRRRSSVPKEDVYHPSRFNLRAFGGDVGIHGGDFSTGMTHIDKGGTHEENPEDGVRIGADLLGIPNLLEEGEVVYKDYVFSKRLEVPDYKKEYKGVPAKLRPYEVQVLWKYSGQPFADAAKKIEKASGVDERPEGNIERNGMEAALAVLAQVQEKERQKEKLQEMQEAIDLMSPELFAMLLQQMEAQLQLQALQANMQQQLMQLLQMMQQPQMEQQQMIPQGMELMVPQELLMSAYGGPIYGLGGLLNSWNNIYAAAGPLLTNPLKEEEPSDFDEWWNKNIHAAELAAVAKRLGIDYGKIYRDFTGDNSNSIISSGLVQDALRKFYDEHPEVFSRPYDFTNYKFLENPETQDADLQLLLEEPAAVEEPVIEEEPAVDVDKSRERLKTIEERLINPDISNPELQAYNYYNSKHKDNPLSVEAWNSADKKTKERRIKLYKASLSKKDRKDYEDQVEYYNTLNERTAAVKKYRDKLIKSYLNKDDLKNYNIDDLNKIARVVNNGEYTPINTEGMSANEKADAKLLLIDNIVGWSEANNITIGDINNAFKKPEAHKNWKTVGYDDLSTWNTNYNFDTFLNDVRNYNGSMHPGLKIGTYAIDPDYDFGNFKTILNLLNDKAFQRYTKLVLDAIDRARDVKWTTDDLGLVYDESNGISRDDYNLLNALYNQTLRTLVNLDELGHTGLVPLFVDSDGQVQLAENAKQLFGHYRSDSNSGVFHKTPTGNSRELYTVQGNIDADTKTPYYHTLALIEHSTPNWKDLYNDNITTLEDGTVLHTLSPNDNIFINRVNSLPEGYVLNEDGSYSVVDEDPFPTPSNWPIVGAGILLALMLGHNIFSPIDYSNAEALEKITLLAGEIPPIGAMFAGQRLPYKPAADTMWGKLQALTAGNARNIINNSSGNIGATIAGLNNNTYLGNIAQGDADLKWRLGNWNMLKDAETFGLQRDSSNYDRLLKADMSTLDAAVKGRGYLLEGAAKAAAMKQALLDNKAATINAGISSLINLANVYNTNRYNQAMIGWGIRNGAYGSQSVDYPKLHRTRSSETNSGAKGGKIKRNKGLSF